MVVSVNLLPFRVRCPISLSKRATTFFRLCSRKSSYMSFRTGASFGSIRNSLSFHWYRFGVTAAYNEQFELFVGR